MTEPRHLDAFNTLCGKLLGQGIHRQVFTSRFRSDHVVKVQHATEFRNFANHSEYETWVEFQHVPKVAKWLAPCEYLSPDGLILIQHRAQPVPDDFELPEKVPYFLTDLKRENFGFLKGHLVCLDYSTVIANLSTQLKKANWNENSS